MIKIIIFFITIVQVGCATHLIAPPFEGVVIDRKTGTGISQANILLQTYSGKVQEVGATSESGAFRISTSSKTVWGIPLGDSWYSGKYLISKDGYLTKEIPFRIGHADTNAKVDLSEIRLESADK